MEVIKEFFYEIGIAIILSVMIFSFLTAVSGEPITIKIDKDAPRMAISCE